jgi:predicted nuclease with RNAse H fold
VPSTEQVPVNDRRVLGIDLGGASSATTGYALLTGPDLPTLASVGTQPKFKSPAVSEDELLALVDQSEPSILAIDAPLTLPPCLTCPSYCRGPGATCELDAARVMWSEGRNPVAQRPCELHVETAVGERPLPTMQLGVLTARAVAFTRRLRARGTPPCSIERGEVLEVYPRATLRRLAASDHRFKATGTGKMTAHDRTQATMALAERIEGLDLDHPALSTDHAFDALITAYTGWLAPDGLEPPPSDFNVGAGWIWFPRADQGA